jgi:hypothetical protein
MRVFYGDKGTSPGCFHPVDPGTFPTEQLEVNMKMVRSLILGSTAAFAAMSGAQAADLPVKAKAVEYVRVCSLYGAGFFYIPGTVPRDNQGETAASIRMRMRRGGADGARA